MTLPVRFHYASTKLPLRCCYDPTTTMKIWLRLVYADGDAAATLLRPRRWSNAFVALLYPFYIESEIQIRFYYDLGASTALRLRFYCALVVSATIRVILTKISNRSGIAVQWNGGFNTFHMKYSETSWQRKQNMLLPVYCFLSDVFPMVLSIWSWTWENLSSGVGEQQMRRPACASAQSDQRLCYSLIRRYHI